jgi:DNA repair exonuclease SbcCD ATPase subunit
VKILTLEVTNWCLHEQRKLEFFNGNLFGFIGGNGTGKSTLFDAMQFALTGETQDKLEQYVRDGESKAKVKMSFTSGKTKVTVTRTVESSGKSSASMSSKDGDEVEKVTGVTNVNNALQLMLSIDRDLAKNNIFVRQKQLDDILFTNPAKRERAWQRMCGMSDAEKIHTYLGKVISGLPERQDQTANILSAKATIDEMETRIAASKSELSVKEDELKVDPSKLSEQIAALTSCGNARVSLAEARKKIEESENLQQLERDKLNQMKDELEALSIPPEPVLRDRIATVDGIIRKIEFASSITRKLEEKQAEADDLRAKVGEAEASGSGMAEVEAGVAQLESELEEANRTRDTNIGYCNMYSKLRQVLSDTEAELAECPMCGSQISDTEVLLGRVNDMITTYEQKKSEANATAAEKSRLLSQGKDILTQHENKISQLRYRLESAEANIASLQADYANYDVSEYDEGSVRDMLTKLQGDLSTLTEKEGKIATQESRLFATVEGYNILKESVSSLEKQAAVYADDVDIPKQIAALKVLEQETSDLCRSIAAIDASIKADESNLINWKNSLAEMERQSGLGSVYEKIEQSLTRVRDWFHYSRGPHQVSVAVLNELNAGVNEFLTTLDGRFAVTPDPENLLFNVVFTDGREQPEEPRSANRLSGGEKASLATAFRLASYYMFAGQLGLLCLDEPTEYLDARKIESFGRFIEQLKEISSKLDLQIFMATHRESIIPLFDQVTKL